MPPAGSDSDQVGVLGRGDERLGRGTLVQLDVPAGPDRKLIDLLTAMPS